MATSRQIRISITSALNAAGIEATKEQIAAMSKSVNKSLGDMSGSSRRHMADVKAGFDMLVGAARSVASVVGGIIKKAFDFESIIISFKTLLGSIDAAKQHVADLRAFASRTPLTFGDLGNASKTLLSFGIAIDDVMPALKMLGDISLGNSEKFKSLALVFGQVKSAGRLMGQDLLQMINQGFNPLTIIAQETGQTMADLKKDMENGAISFEMVEAAMRKATSAGGLFHNAMENAATTGNGLISTLEDNWTQAIETFGAAFVSAAKDGLGTLIEWLQRLNQDGTISVWADRTAVACAKVADAIKTATGWVGKLVDAYRWVQDKGEQIGSAVGTGVGYLMGGGSSLGEMWQQAKGAYNDSGAEIADRYRETAEREAKIRVEAAKKAAEEAAKAEEDAANKSAQKQKSIAELYAEQKAKAEEEANANIAAKAAERERALAVEKRKAAGDFIAAQEAEQKKAEREELRRNKDNLKKLHDERMRDLDERIRKAREEADIWERNAQRARGVNLNDFTRNERDRVRGEREEKNRMNNQKAVAERELERLEANARRGRAFTNDRDQARIKQLREWLDAQNPANNPALKQVNQLEQDKLKAAQDAAKALDNIEAKLNNLGL